MRLLRSLLTKIGFAEAEAVSDPLYIFLLDDDVRRHEWFQRRFANDYVDIAETPDEAIKRLRENRYDAIYLDHDLLPDSGAFGGQVFR